MNFFKNLFGDEIRSDAVSIDEIPEQVRNEIIDKIATEIVDRRLTAPALLFGETIKPINRIAGQLSIFFEPLIQTVFPVKYYREATIVLSDRVYFEKLLTKIEELSQKTP
ncbi:hypothetical protein J7J58_01240 [candidate division WOR-3 bacterium]|uniref:Uncharacterized protein n=1 Tax=candidate division TA06 bacterium TaxID=2250710 RepID=A0A660S7X0_UNCT6|nr:hypothetical protein [candidate division WOR-3 bacterium]RKX66052.1 MAG: hypothetical protein DRP44_04955 [candidate division TA06 bacterium]HHD82530.1 hypothetical protein [Bacteroidota bacterium]